MNVRVNYLLDFFFVLHPIRFFKCHIFHLLNCLEEAGKYVFKLMTKPELLGYSSTDLSLNNSGLYLQSSIDFLILFTIFKNLVTWSGRHSTPTGIEERPLKKSPIIIL